MEFFVVGYDGTDAQAPARRQKCRPAHLAGMERLKNAGHLLYGGAILDANGNMVGSAGVFEFADREHLDRWLHQDPYVTGGVWERIEVHPFRVVRFD